MKTKYQDTLLDNKRLQDRIDSLEFYAKTNTNSSVFHNLAPTTSVSSSLSGVGSNSASSMSSRARTPAPTASRQRLPSSSTTYSGNGGINYGTTSAATSPSAATGSNSASNSNPLSPTTNSSFTYFDNYRPASRTGSRQSSVERSFENNNSNNNNTSSLYGGGTSSFNLNSSTSGSAMRSRNTSPSRAYDTSANDRWLAMTTAALASVTAASSSADKPTRTSYDSTSSGYSTDRPTRSTYDTYSSSGNSAPTTDRWSSNTRNLTSLPPIYDSYSRLRAREPSTDITNIQLRQRRDTSQERSIRPSTSSSLLKFRRSSFVESPNLSTSKYY